MKLTTDEIKLLIIDTETRCKSYTLRAAKRFLMLACTGDEDAWKLFSAPLEAKNKKILCNAFQK